MFPFDGLRGIQQGVFGRPKRLLGRRTTKTCLVILATFTVAQSGLAQVCDIMESITMGQNKSPDVHAFVGMSQISSVSYKGPTKKFSNGCPVAGDYSYAGNILSTKAKCEGTFDVTGVKVGCVATPPTGISQAPLFLTDVVEPNIMFVLDDSGSMRFEMVPEQLTAEHTYSTYYVFPREDKVYDSSAGAGEYSNYVASVDDGDPYNARTRSPQVNTIYYDPSVTYQPWVKADGTRYANASPSCALHNPERPGVGAAYCRDLTVTNGNSPSASPGYTCWINSDPSTSHCGNRTFWPASYFWLTEGADPQLWGSFTKVEIKPATATYAGHNRGERSDCADSNNGICSYNEEIQNFANWYTYYRSRVLLSRAGTGLAFSQQGSGLRVGFGAINKGGSSIDGVNTGTIIKGVRQFTGADRQAFYDQLYQHSIPAAGTPLRTALDAAGQYFKRADNSGPWSSDPANASAEPHIACRRCYTVMMTDGYWTGGAGTRAATAGAQANNDGIDGPANTNDRPNGFDLPYVAEQPFSDGRDNTLADVAMYYWKNDLRDNLYNIVGPVTADPAYWQHMTTFGVGLGVTGDIDPDDAFAAIQPKTAIAWPDPNEPSSNCAGATCNARVDDLLHAAVNSRGAFFSASEPGKFATDLSDMLNSIVGDNRSSSSSIAANSTRLDEGTFIYQASFNGLYWTGQLRAFQPDPKSGQVDLTKPSWNTDEAGTFESPATRNIFTTMEAVIAEGKSAVDAIPFQWASLSDNQKNALQPVDGLGEDRLNWLRGDQSEEKATFRSREVQDENNVTRNVLLGDIINSDPLFVGNSEDYGFRALPGDEGTKYVTYLATKVSAGGKLERDTMLYVGANDGMLHGFNAKTGKEVFGFIPAGVFANLYQLPATDYQHRYFVDGSPRASDVYFSDVGVWKTVVVGSTGAGGRSVFALDVTDPSKVDKDSLLWEFSTKAADVDQLGYAMSQPVIARVKAGDSWVVMFGNGYEAGAGIEGLFVLDLQSGNVVKVIHTGETSVGNGLSSIVPVDINNDRITDYAYAGDLKGNLWRFDFTSNSDAGWSVFKVFTAIDKNGLAQPITSRPAVGRHPDGGLMIYFGTGKYFENGDAELPADPQVQSFYGVRDELGNVEVKRADLAVQTIEFEGLATLQGGGTTAKEVRAVSTNAATQFGWYMDLIPPKAAVGEGERVVSSPLVRFGRVIFVSIIPDQDPCANGGTSWLMELDALTGGRFPSDILDINNDGKIDSNDMILVGGVYVPVSGVGSEEMIKTPGIVGAGEIEFKYTSGSGGSIGVLREKGGGAAVGRQSWRQLQ